MPFARTQAHNAEMGDMARGRLNLDWQSLVEGVGVDEVTIHASRTHD